MKVLLVNTSTRGGAAKACIRLQRGLINLGIEVGILCRDNIELITNVEVLSVPKQSKRDRLIRRILNYLIRKKILNNSKSYLINSKPFRQPELEYFSLPISDFDITTSILYQQADIIHLHWVSDFLDWQSFFKKNKKPIVWTFHDQSPFLGGEHYAERFFGIDLDGYPVIRHYSLLEKEYYENIIAYKKKILGKVKNLIVIANSEWIKDSAIKSTLFKKFQIKKILCGFPTNTFYPRERTISKLKLGISSDTVTILFVADSIVVKRKGFAYLELALNSLPTKYSSQITLLVIGSNENYTFKNARIKFLGRVSDEDKLAIIYSASDLFIIPSLEEAFGQTTVEALLCGTPCIGFPTGGITEVIEDGINGYLCPEISVHSLKEAIIRFIDNFNKFDRNEIADAAKKKYSLDQYAKSYLAVYNDILN